MRACKFSLAESLDRGKQMVIRRAVAKGSNGQLMPPPNVIEASMTAETSTVSPLTNQTSVAAGGRSRKPNIVDSSIDADDYGDNAHHG